MIRKYCRKGLSMTELCHEGFVRLFFFRWGFCRNEYRGNCLCPDYFERTDAKSKKTTFRECCQTTAQPVTYSANM